MFIEEVSKGRTEKKVFKGLMKQTDRQTQNVYIEKYRKDEQKRKFKTNETNRQTDKKCFY